jgi:hypothetical protein
MLENSGLFTPYKIDDILIQFLTERKSVEPKKACTYELAREVLLNSILNQRHHSYNEDEAVVLLRALEVRSWWWYVYIYIYIYKYMYYTYIYINTCIYLYEYMYIEIYVFIYVSIYMYIYICICTFTYTFMHAYMYMYIYAYTYDGYLNRWPIKALTYCYLRNNL